MCPCKLNVARGGGVSPFNVMDMFVDPPLSTPLRRRNPMLLSLAFPSTVVKGSRPSLGDPFVSMRGFGVKEGFWPPNRGGLLVNNGFSIGLVADDPFLLPTEL